MIWVKKYKHNVCFFFLLQPILFRFEGGRGKLDNLELDNGEDLPDIEDMKIEVQLNNEIFFIILKIIPT